MSARDCRFQRELRARRDWYQFGLLPNYNAPKPVIRGVELHSREWFREQYPDQTQPLKTSFGPTRMYADEKPSLAVRLP